MTFPWEAADTALLGELRALFDEVDPVPSTVLAAGRASWTWRTMEAELAELVADTERAGLAGAGVRSGDGPRLLTFQAPELTVEVEVAAYGDRRRLVGQLVPPVAATVEVRCADHATPVVTRADELGRFRVDGVPAGPVSLVCRPGSGPTVVTSWLVV